MVELDQVPVCPPMQNSCMSQSGLLKDNKCATTSMYAWSNDQSRTGSFKLHCVLQLTSGTTSLQGNLGKYNFYGRRSRMSASVVTVDSSNNGYDVSSVHDCSFMRDCSVRGGPASRSRGVNAPRQSALLLDRQGPGISKVKGHSSTVLQSSTNDPVHMTTKLKGRSSTVL